jgi:plastocyanin
MKPLAIALTLAGCVLAARAGTLEISVSDRDGRPASDVVVLVEGPARVAATPAAGPVVITQESLRFVPFLTVVPAGSTLRFANKDAYDHHVRSMPSGPLGATPPVKSFEFRLDAAEGAAAAPVDEYQAAPRPRRRSGAAQTSADVLVDRPGPIGLGCHIHGSMRGQVYVSPTPWFAKTDTDGRARIDNVPAGPVEVTLWHADQLTEQPPQRLQVGSGTLAASAQRHFVPRRRRN